MNRIREMKKKNSGKLIGLSGEMTEFSVGLHIDKNEKTGVLPRIFRVIFAYLGSIGAVMCFVSAVFPNRISAADIALTALFPMAVCAAAAFSRKGGNALIISAYALTAIFALKVREKITAGFYLAFNLFYEEIGIKYKEWDLYDLSVYTRDETEEGLRLLFIALTLLISLTAGTFMIYRTSAIMVFASIFPLFEFVLYFGLVPNYFYAAAVICAFVFSISAEVSEFPVTGKSRRVPVYAKTSAEAAFMGAAIFLFCFLFCDRYVTLSGFERTDKMNDFRVQFSSYMRSFSFKKFANDLAASMPSDADASGAINHGLLGRSDSIEFTDNVMLRVTLPKSQDNTYLKGFIGVNYTGNSWEELSDKQTEDLNEVISRFETPFLSPQFLDGYSLEKYSAITGEYFEEIGITVQNTGANNSYGYIPYALTPDTAAGTEIVSDKAVAKENEFFKAYRVTPAKRYGFVSFNDFSSVIENADEKAYRKFVYDNYLDIPESFTAAKYIYGSVRRQSLESELVSLRSYLGNNCEYSLDAGKTPFGEDFAQYFITENRKGSCSHFATTAALMCRYRGIPARYVEGYVIKPEDFPADKSSGELAAVDITDERAHAWIEIYLDGYGWLPYEVTPGYTESLDFSESYVGTGESNELILTKNPALPTGTDNNAAAAETSVSEKKTETEIMTESESYAEETLKSDEKEENVTYYEEKWDPLPVIITVSALLVVFSFFAVRYMKISESRERRLRGKNNRQKSYAAGKYFIKLCAYKKIIKSKDESYEAFSERAGRMLETENAGIILSAALKSKFGRTSPEKEEAENAAEKVAFIADSIYGKLGKKDKFLFRYFYCLK